MNYLEEYAKNQIKEDDCYASANTKQNHDNTVTKTKSNKLKTQSTTPNVQLNHNKKDKDLPIKKLNMDEEPKHDKLSNHSIKNYNEIEDKDTAKNN